MRNRDLLEKNPLTYIFPHFRRSTYVVRPVPKTGGIPAAAGESPVVDPYRYYYEYH